jgi:hypothetical protein
MGHDFFNIISILVLGLRNNVIQTLAVNIYFFLMKVLISQMP